ncbi:MAG: NifU N-terminal domain-containing protein [Planctomycetota bacterium]
MPLTIRPEPTPNPNAMRLALSAPALGDRPRTFSASTPVADAPWAARLLEIRGVVSLFGLRDFLTITKAPNVAWDAILPKAIDVLSTDLA